MREARIEETEAGLVPAGEGWFILNVADIAWESVPGSGTWCSFEPPSQRSETLGVGVHVLHPGDSTGYYHLESEQEGFLVLSGECIAVVEGVERRMGPWDYFHSPPETAHIMVGAGGQPCALLTVGTRSPGTTTHYVPDPAAAKHGASVAEPTDSAKEAYAGRPPFSPARSPWKELRPDR